MPHKNPLVYVPEGQSVTPEQRKYASNFLSQVLNQQGIPWTTDKLRLFGADGNITEDTNSNLGIAIQALRKQYPAAPVMDVTNAPLQKGILGANWGGLTSIRPDVASGPIGRLMEVMRHELSHSAGLDDSHARNPWSPDAYDVSHASQMLDRDIELPALPKPKLGPK